MQYKYAIMDLTSHRIHYISYNMWANRNVFTFPLYIFISALFCIYCEFPGHIIDYYHSHLLFWSPQRFRWRFWLLVVNLQMRSITLRVIEALATFLTSIRFLSCVNSQMNLQITCFGVTFTTDWAEVRALSGVSLEVHVEVGGLWKRPPTLITVEILFSSVR